MDSKPKVLIVDDEELSQEFLRFFLAKKFEVYTCGCVNAFYNLINKMDFDLIVMDISLRDYKDGIQLTRELKNMPRFEQVPVFVLTAHNTTKDRHDSLEAGAYQFLTKPVDVRSLVTRIDEVLMSQRR